MTDPTHSPLPMASTGCACCAPAPATDHATAAAGTASAGSTAAYQVEGMTCGHCASSVTEELTALEGVREVHIDLVAGGTSAVTVTAEHPLSTEEVRVAVEEAGYTLATD
ncbi:heavy-metal-associated domain-containing protein [Kocuria oceani]|uniref:Heavy-metal-associated domain-containing protein n=1 Tax=Kocuria oceani TaxID=988827 RepID=A0ABV9TG34_9MICC|nr:heavy-metal-associated domain-containing protein [Kocuria oceani]